jgi:hypothetical protein
MTRHCGCSQKFSAAPSCLIELVGGTLDDNPVLSVVDLLDDTSTW